MEISLEFGGPTSGSHRKDKQTVLTPSMIGARLPEIITVQPSDVLVPTNGLGEWVTGGMGYYNAPCFTSGEGVDETRYQKPYRGQLFTCHLTRQTDRPTR